jgi:intracellular septation protein
MSDAAGNAAKTVNPQDKPLFKLATEVGPLAVFFLVYVKFGLFPATAALMAATAVALVASKIVFGKLPIMPMVSGGFVLVLGALTLYLQNEIFIFMKPTIVNTLFAAILFGGLAFGRNLLKIVLGEVLQLREEGWRILTIRWALFFIFLACLNEVMWRNFSEETWVQFKVFGIMPITLAFTISQIGLLQRYQIEPESRDAPGA